MSKDHFTYENHLIFAELYIEGVVRKLRHTIFDPLPHRHAFYYKGLCTGVTKSLTPPLKTVTSFMEDP